MMTLLFALFLAACALAYFDQITKAYWAFAAGLALSLYWLNFHSTSTLDIQL